MIELYTMNKDGSLNLVWRDTAAEVARSFRLGPHSTANLAAMRKGDSKFVSWPNGHSFNVVAV